jgi:hypothetical protein
MGSYVQKLLDLVEGSPTSDKGNKPGNPWHDKDGHFGLNKSGASVWASVDAPGEHFLAYPSKNRTKEKPWSATKAKGIPQACGRWDRSVVCKHAVKFKKGLRGNASSAKLQAAKKRDSEASA